MGNFVNSFLTTNLDYSDLFDEETSNKLWEEFIDYMYKRGFFTGVNTEPSNGNTIDTKADLGTDLNGKYSDEQTYKDFIRNFRNSRYWNESVLEAAKQFYNDFLDPDKRAVIDEYLADAGNSFAQNTEYVKEWLNANNQSYSEVRGLDKIESVLTSKENLQFTREKLTDEELSEIDKVKTLLRLIMPKYSRRVEIEDLNRNFWVIGQTLDFVLDYLLGEQSPMIELLGKLIKESAESWQNIYFLWATTAALEGKINDVLTDIKKIEAGTEKTPLNIYLHLPTSDSNTTDETWLRLFNIYNRKDQIESFEVTDLCLFGSSSGANPSYILAKYGDYSDDGNNPTLVGVDQFLWIKQYWSDATPTDNYYPGYNGYCLIGPHTQDSYDIDVSKLTIPTKCSEGVKGLTYPRLGGAAIAKIRFRGDNVDTYTMCAYDMGHPFSSTQSVNDEIGETEITNEQYLKKVKKVNNSFWDIFNYANYDKVSGCTDIIQNRILYDNIEWERKEEYGKVRMYSSNEQKLDHTVNDFANLHYSRTKANADKRDMAQIIQDVASFNYVYRFKNSSTDLTNSTIADYIPYKKGEQTSYLSMFYDFLSSLLDVATNSAEIVGEDESQIIRPGYAKFTEYFYADLPTIQKLPNRIQGLENFKELFNLPTLKNLKDSYTKLISDIKDSSKKTKALCDFIEEFLLEIFGFSYEEYIEKMRRLYPSLTNEEGEISFSDNINMSLIANISCRMSKIFLNLEDLNVSDELLEKFKKCSLFIIGGDSLTLVKDSEMETNPNILVSKQDLKEMLRCYVLKSVIQNNQRDLSSYSINPFLTLSMPWNFSQTYNISQYARETLQAVQNNNENFLVEIIATGTDAAATTFVNDKYNSLTTPIEMYYSDEADNKKPKFPAVNRYMQYERQNGSTKPRINMLVTSTHDMESIIGKNDVNANVMFDTLAASGILQGFGIIVEEDCPSIKNDYLAAYIQPNFSNVTGYEFRFIDNPATSYGKFKINIINYSARYFQPHGITGASYPTICFNCHNSSLNIPFDLSNTMAGQNRLTDIFSVGMPMPVGKTFTMEELQERNVHQIRYESGYFYKYINTSESRPTSLEPEMKLGISDGCFGVRGAATGQLLQPTITNIDLSSDTTSYNIFKQKKDFKDYATDTEERTWHYYITKAYNENFFSQWYIDNKDIKYNGQNFINPIFAYSGDNGGINGLRDMYISTSIPALPYYRLDSATKYGNTYTGYNSHGGKEKPLENFHEEASPQIIYNQEYSAYNDIYIRDIVPLNYTKPKVYVDISVFSDFNTIFKVEFLKDEYKVKFPGLSKREDIPIDSSFGNGSFNFIKIGNYSNKKDACKLAKKELTDDNITQDNFEYVKIGTNSYQGTNYIYNFRYLYSTSDVNETSCWCELFNITNNTLQITEYKIRDNDTTERAWLKQSDVINAGMNVISHFITQNKDYWYQNKISKENRENSINYFITGIGRQPEHLNNQEAYWFSSTLCHAFATIPSKIVLREYDNIELNIDQDELKRKFGEENIVPIASGSKIIYLILLGPINLTEGYFEFLVGDEGDQTLEIVDRPAGYYIPTNLDRWRGPFVEVRENSDQHIRITADIEKIISNSGIKYKVDNVQTIIPESIDITCGMLDYRTAQSGTNLSEDKYTVIKGNFKLNLQSDEIFAFDDGLAFCSRAGSFNSMSINNSTCERENNATLDSCFNLQQNSPLRNVLVKDAIFTNSRTLPYRE